MKEAEKPEDSVDRCIDISPDKEDEEQRDKSERYARQYAYNKIAGELGFDSKTTNKDEIDKIDKRYEEILEEVSKWNEEEQQKIDNFALAGLYLKNGWITSNDEYERICDGFWGHWRWDKNRTDK